MVNWYYVLGSERVGPVSFDALKELFLKDDINLETYVWKKGFQNWERLKDVGELKFDEEEALPIEIETPEPVVQVRVEPKPEPKVQIAEVNSPEITFSFNWNKVKENSDLFFVRIGKDRKDFSGSDIFGPYSMAELQEALEGKRVNLQTLIFSPGMGSWTKMQDTPLNKSFKGAYNSAITLTEVPLVLVFDHSPEPLITIVKKAGLKEGILLGAGPFAKFQNKTVKASLYVGNEIKARNVQVAIQGYDKKDQSIDCQFINLSQDAKKIMLNHAV